MEYTNKPIHSILPSVRRYRIAIFLLTLIPAFVLIPHILHTWVGIPFWDDWGTPGRQLYLMSLGKLSIKELFSMHNESRPFFPRLVFISLDWFGWDPRKAIAAIFLMVCTASCLLYRLLGKLHAMAASEMLAVLLLMNAVLFWPISEIWTFENTFMMVWPPVMLLAALNVNLSDITFRRKVIFNSLLATVSTYSWANGMQLWLFALPLPGIFLRLQGFSSAGEKREARWYLAYALVCAINLTCYFHDYKHGSLSWNVPLVMRYFFTWIGAFFGDFEMAFRYGLCVFIAYVMLAGTYSYVALRRRDYTAGYPWLILGSYGVASGVLTSMGRAEFGLGQAMSPRYTAVSGYLYIAIIGLGYLVWRTAADEWMRKKIHFLQFVAWFAAGLLMLVVTNGYSRGFALMEEISTIHRTALIAWQWSRVIPNGAGLTLLCWDPEIVEERGAALERNHVLKVKRWGPEIAAKWSYKETAANSGNGALDICKIGPDGNKFAVEGWAGLPGRNSPADYVLVTVCEEGGVPHPWLVLPADTRERPDVMAALKSKEMLHSGFHQEIATSALPAGKLTVAAWAVDMKLGSISPLANTFVVEARHK